MGVNPFAAANAESDETVVADVRGKPGALATAVSGRVDAEAGGAVAGRD